MAVFAPPPPTPEQATVASVREAGREVASVAYRDYRIHIHGAAVLDADAIAAAMAAAGTLSDAVRALAQAYCDAGYPATRLYYARVDRELYVLVQPRGIVAVRAPEPLRRYFEGLPGREPLRTTDLEPQRVLASAHADRAGLTAEPIFVRESGGEVLDLKPHDGPDPTSLALEFGNPGNRFSGRYFLDLEIHHARPSGDEFDLSWSRALTGLDDGNGAEDFDEQNLGWSRVTPWGLFWLRGRHVSFSQQQERGGPGTGAATYDGSTRELDLSWSYPVFADLDSRTTFDLGIHYTQHEQAEILGAEVLSQEYGALQAGVFHAVRLRLRERELLIDGGVTLRGGLGDERLNDPLVAADLGYALYQPELHIELPLRRNWNLRLESFAQYTDDALPQEEQWVAGGFDSLQAWVPGVAVGDRGALVRLVVGRDAPEPGFRLKPAVFVEHGYAEFEIAPPGYPGGEQWLTDAGLELSADLDGWLQAKLVWAQPLQEDGIDQARLDDSEANVFFSLKAQFGRVRPD